MTKIAQIAAAPEVHFQKCGTVLRKLRTYRIKAYDRVEGEKLSITGNLVEFLGNLVDAAST
jgi:hypothetical protein